tara:strand:- start:102 stop:1319 length:1218 start_codon:yes stop_codon:yes gene_type:complete
MLNETLSTKTKQVDPNNSNPDFDWDAYEATCPKSSRTTNKNIKTPRGVKLYSKEPYAAEMLAAYEGDFKDNNRIEKCDVGENHTGVVEHIDLKWSTINVGYRDSVYVDITKESESSRELLKPGNTVSVQIIESKGSKDGKYILGSVEAGVKKAIFAEILESVSGNTAYKGTVKSIIPGGGYIVSIQGVDCFMPGSLAGINKLHDFESILEMEMYVVPMNFSQDRGTIVVSHREYLKAMIPSKIEEIKQYEHGTLVKGTVTGSAKYGVFCEFNECLTGMIHANDLDEETTKRHISREILPGEEIEFFIKKVISDNKITLSQNPMEPMIDPWKGASEKFKTPIEVIGKIKAIKGYGIFVDIGEGLVGLLHVSEFPEGYDINELDTGGDITVTVTRIEEDTRKVFLEL